VRCERRFNDVWFITAVPVANPQHDQDVMEMNEAHDRASGWVQRAPPKVVGMIDKPGHSDRSTS